MEDDSTTGSKPRAVPPANGAAPPRLSEEEARAIAMTWQRQLETNLRLVVGTDGPVDSIAESYAWVQINDSPNRAMRMERTTAEHRRREMLSVTRAVVVSWATLAACPGYSGSENEGFWKSVISALQEGRPPPGSGYERRVDIPDPVSDAFGFFDLPGHTFPRFMVKTPKFLDHDFAELLLPEGPELLPEVSDQLNAVLAHLRVFSVSQANAPPQPIDVSLHLRNYDFTTGNNRLLSAIVLCANSSRASASFPQFRIRSLVPGGTHFYYETQIDGFFDLVRTMPVPIGHTDFFGFETTNSREKKASWLKALLHMDDHGKQIGVTSDDTFEQIDLPWLAYAIFHPHTTASSWCHLKLTDLKLTEHSTHVLTAMARGNNLLAVLSGTSPTSDAYYRAQLTPGTVVEREPCWTIDRLVSRGMQDIVFSAPLGKSTPTTVDVCGIASLDSTTWSEWVQVIVPAYGLGWVRTSELQNVRAHKPSESGFWGLRLCQRYNFRGVPDGQPEALLHVLRPLGAKLTFLDVSAYNDLERPRWGIFSEHAHV